MNRRSGPSRAVTSPALPSLMIAAVGLTFQGCVESSASDHIDAGALPRLAATERLRLGSVDDPESGFSRVTDVDVDHDGNMYVMDAQDVQIRVWGPEGEPLRRIGRRGEGPGEFEVAPEFGVVGDTVWAIEAYNRRLTLFDRRGTVLSDARYEPLLAPVHDSRSIHVRPIRMHPGGWFVGHESLIGVSGSEPRTSGPTFQDTDTVPIPIVRFGPDGESLDTLGFRPKPPPAPDPPTERVEAMGRSLPVPRPPWDGTLTALLPDGTIVIRRPTPAGSVGAAFSVTRLTFEGDTVHHRVFDYGPKTYPDAVLDTIAARQAVWYIVGRIRIEGGVVFPPDPPSEDLTPAISALRAAMDFGGFQPPVQDYHVGADDAVWLRREDLGGPTFDWLVLDPDGAPRGVVELPRGLRVVWSRGRDVIGVETDDLGVPWVVAYRLNGS